MKRYLLDTSALLTLRDDEKGADKASRILYEAQKNTSASYGCFISLMEILYRVWKDENQLAGRLAYEQCQSLPIIWIHESKGLLEQAAEIKATQRMSLADAWISASAIQASAILVHKDPEFNQLDCPQLKLPFK